MLLPFISLESNYNAVAPIAELTEHLVPEALVYSLPTEDNTITDVHGSGPTNYSTILSLIYLLGVLFFLTKFVFTLLHIVRIKRSSKQKKDGKFLLIYTNLGTYFSFFHWIFIPKERALNVNTTILYHEKVHSQKMHSLDILLSEIYKVFLWFNPLVYFFQKKLKTIHEYQVDRAALKKESAAIYLQTMLDNLTYGTQGKLCNFFGELGIKKRISMITKNKTAKWKILSYILIFPMIALLVMSFNYKRTVPVVHSAIEVDPIIIPQITNPPSILPIQKPNLSSLASGFGMRMHPFLKVYRQHIGVDFTAKLGTEIVATADGTVSTAEHDNQYGNYVTIKHDNHFETRYAHMQRYIVANGEKIKKGQVIGYVGNSGRSAAPHLHYEVIKDGKFVDPAPYLPKK